MICADHLTLEAGKSVGWAEGREEETGGEERGMYISVREKYQRVFGMCSGDKQDTHLFGYDTIRSAGIRLQGARSLGCFPSCSRYSKSFIYASKTAIVGEEAFFFFWGLGGYVVGNV